MGRTGLRGWSARTNAWQAGSLFGLLNAVFLQNIKSCGDHRAGLRLSRSHKYARPTWVATKIVSVHLRDVIAAKHSEPWKPFR